MFFYFWVSKLEKRDHANIRVFTTMPLLTNDMRRYSKRPCIKRDIEMANSFFAPQWHGTHPLEVSPDCVYCYAIFIWRSVFSSLSSSLPFRAFESTLAVIYWLSLLVFSLNIAHFAGNILPCEHIYNRAFLFSSRSSPYILWDNVIIPLHFSSRISKTQNIEVDFIIPYSFVFPAKRPFPFFLCESN